MLIYLVYAHVQFNFWPSFCLAVCRIIIFRQSGLFLQQFQQTQRHYHNVVTTLDDCLYQHHQFVGIEQTSKRDVVAMLLQRNTKVVTILQSRNFIKCLTTFPFNCLNVVSANILVFLGKLMPLCEQLTLNSVNTLTIKSFAWRPYKQIKIRVLQCWINVGAMSEQINGISEYYCCAQLSWLI